MQAAVIEYARSVLGACFLVLPPSRFPDPGSPFTFTPYRLIGMMAL